MRRVWVRRSAAAGLAGALLLGLAAQAAADGDGSGGLRISGQEPTPQSRVAFNANQTYADDFPDPSVMKVGSRYYAYSTTIDNKNLPMLTSSDLVTWQARPSYSASATDNDALPNSAVWSQWSTINNHRVSRTWAPSVAIVSGRYVEAYATPVAGQNKFCISTARSTSALGPFVDNTTSPLVCPTGQGAIDPFIYKWHKKYWLLYKTEGRSGVPPKIWSRQLNKYATGFARHSKPKVLLTPQLSWEGGVIENPAMVVYGKHLYLFYSANNWASDRYRIGYAVCTSIQKPCKRPTRYPLMGNTTTISGPGGESPFIDAGRNLRMAYHSWTPGAVGYSTSSACKKNPAVCPQRRLHIAQLLRVPGTKRLQVVNSGARQSH